MILGTGGAASAALDALDAGLLVSSSILDVDYYSLTQISGFTPYVALSISDTVTATGFTETLAGTYQGNNVDITYTGDSTGYPNTDHLDHHRELWRGQLYEREHEQCHVLVPTSSTFMIQYLSSWDLGPNSAQR